MIRNIPNFLTCCNIICGFFAIIAVLKGHYIIASYWVYAGAGFDFFDGLAARLLKAHSNIGKDLDSLADMVTFGLVPGFVVYKLIGFSNNEYLPYIGVLIPVFSAWRLAKFNNDTRQSVDFLGLPTPANAIFFVSLIHIILNAESLAFLNLDSIFILIPIVIAFCLLMVSDIKLFSLKIKSLNFKANLFQFILIISSVILFSILLFASLPIIVILYIILSLIKNTIKIQ
ncbi:MAG: CDP-diacylglycerol--serine O-phosphatidyltransferase [Bacteroidetes bacterium]|nr:MAG: CDP-diacylglycerol--serine O-phosphatidyltransferase [Bacteroidota bacterium]